MVAPFTAAGRDLLGVVPTSSARAEHSVDQLHWLRIVDSKSPLREQCRIAGCPTNSILPRKNEVQKRSARTIKRLCNNQTLKLPKDNLPAQDGNLRPEQPEDSPR